MTVRPEHIAKIIPLFIVPRQIPVQKEQSGEALLSIQRGETCLILPFYTSVNEVEIER